MWIQKVPGVGVDALVYSPDGSTLFVLNSLGRIDAWDIATRTTTPLVQLGTKFGGRPTRLLVTADGRYLVVFHSSFVAAYQAVTGKYHAQVCTDWPQEARLAPGGARLALLDRYQSGGFLWDIATTPNRLDQLPLPEIQPNAKVLSFDFTLDGALVVVLGEDQVIVGDVTSGAEHARFTALPLGKVAHVRFTPDGGALCLFTEHQLILWDIARDAVRAKSRDPIPFDVRFALNPTQPVFATLPQGRGLTLHHLSNGEPLRTLDFDLGRRTRCVCFSPDGLTCAVGGSNQQFAVFDVDL